MNQEKIESNFLLKKIIAGLILLVYCFVLFKVLVFKYVAVIRFGSLIFNFGGTQDGPANLIPFKTIGSYLLGHSGWLIGGLNLVGNITLLIPVGILSVAVHRQMSWPFSLVLAACTGMAIEGTQALFRVGIFDIDDVILNGSGVLIGIWITSIYQQLTMLPQFKKYVLISLILTIFLIGIFIYFGYREGYLPIGIERMDDLRKLKNDP